MFALQRTNVTDPALPDDPPRAARGLLRRPCGIEYDNIAFAIAAVDGFMPRCVPEMIGAPRKTASAS